MGLDKIGLGVHHFHLFSTSEAKQDGKNLKGSLLMTQVSLDQVFPVSQEALWKVLSILPTHHKEIRIVRENEWIKRLEFELTMSGLSVDAVMQIIPMGQFGSLLRVMTFMPSAKSVDSLDHSLGSIFSEMVNTIANRLKEGL